MLSEKKSPVLCLKLGVSAALCRGEKVLLKNAPIIDGDRILIPSEALALVGEEHKDGYVSLDSIISLKTVYNDMGLVFLGNADSPILNTASDLHFILKLAHSFIFDISVGELSTVGNYAPATDSEREGFKKVGKELCDILLERNNTHPFLFGSQSVFDKLRAIYEAGGDTELGSYLHTLVKRADSYLSKLPSLNGSKDGFDGEFPSSGYGEDEYDVGGRHTTSEGTLLELAHVAFAYQITREEDYARIAYYGALEVINRKHWGPGHFLNCSGATTRLAMIYDWLATDWAKMGLDGGLVRRGIFTHGLHHGFNSVVLDVCDFPSSKQGTGWRFKLKPDNWNSVCNCGMIVGSLCVLADSADEYIDKDEYEKITELLGACITSTMQPHLVFTQYAPDGSYVESNSYWAYGTTNLITSMSALFDSLGTDLGLHRGCGFDKTCYYAINTESAEFIGWNYHDGSLNDQNTSCFNPLAVISSDTQLSAIRSNQLKEGKSVAILDVLYHPEVRGTDVPELSALPLDYTMSGIDAFTVRGGWTKGSLFAGMIGGENPTGGSHNQLDSGAFVYHNLGRMWFTDLGSDYYNSVGKNNGQGYFSNYSLYRRNAEGNNVIALKSLEFGQLLGGRGVMTDAYSSDTASYCIIDNTSVYGEDKVKSAKRGMLLTNGRKTLVIKDEMEFTDTETAYFTAHYESDKITAQLLDGGKKCVLTHNEGEKIYVTILGDGVIEIADCQNALLDGTYEAEGEYSRANFSRLLVRHENITSFNTSFVIDVCEDVGVSENLDVEMWKTL